MNGQKNSLQMIYSLVLGIIFAIFIAVGINTFYPYPDMSTDARLTDINNKYSDCYDLNNNQSSYGQKAESQCMNNLDKERTKIQNELQQKGKNWATVVSIFLIVTATVVVSLSLFLSEKLAIISNGLLLGSFFILIGGVGTSLFTSNKVVQFIIITSSLIITIAVGYFVFIKRKSEDELRSGTLNNI